MSLVRILLSWLLTALSQCMASPLDAASSAHISVPTEPRAMRGRNSTRFFAVVDCYPYSTDLAFCRHLASFSGALPQNANMTLGIVEYFVEAAAVAETALCSSLPRLKDLQRQFSAFTAAVGRVWWLLRVEICRSDIQAHSRVLNFEVGIGCLD